MTLIVTAAWWDTRIVVEEIAHSLFMISKLRHFSCNITPVSFIFFWFRFSLFSPPKIVIARQCVPTHKQNTFIYFHSNKICVKSSADSTISTIANHFLFSPFRLNYTRKVSWHLIRRNQQKTINDTASVNSHYMNIFFENYFCDTKMK